MLWYKTWLDTRWRFLIGLGILSCAAVVVVLVYPRIAALLPLVPTVDTGGEIGRRIRESADLVRDYRGYIWSQWYRQTPTTTATLFAALLGSGGLLSQGFSGGGLLFTLSLPVSRRRWIGVRAAAGLAELLALALVPSLVLPAFSPAVGQSYSMFSALALGLCQFFALSVFFSLAVLLSTVFDDLWRPLLISLTVATAVGLVESVSRELSPYSIFTVMNGEVYFRTGSLPWLGLLATAAVSAALLYGATVNIARRDF